MTLKKVVRPDPPDNREIGEPCPECGTPTRRDFIECPDRKPGCCVAHFGWVCPKGCGDFVLDHSSPPPNATEPSEPSV